MKSVRKFVVALLTCSSLIIQDGTARGLGSGGAGAGRATANRSLPARSVSRPATASRSPVTASRMARPSNRLATGRPATTRPSVSRPSVSARPTTRPSVTTPTTRPSVTTPATRPSVTTPATRPATLPANRPQTRPTTKPGNVTYPRPDRPSTLPGTANRPSTLPGTANRPGIGGGNRPSTLPGSLPGSNNRPGIGGGNRPTTLPATVNRPGWNTKPIQRPVFNRPGGNRPGNNNNWGSIGGGNSNNWWNLGNQRPGIGGGIGSGIGNNTNININNNFQKNVNWSTNRSHWGYNPWWNRPATRPWYGGSWNCGWNNRWYRHHSSYYWGGFRPLPGYVVVDDHHNDFAEAIGWGLAAWGLGTLIYNSGYNTYRNPYPAPPVATTSGTPVTYTQPITIVAATTAPQDAAAIAAATAASESHIQQSQEAFKTRNYLAALDSANKAVGESPGDGALHEYRALVLFALGKYGEAAGVLNPVLASGPGWDWTTMVTLYDAQETYTAQLESLEQYTAARPADAAANFLLGYHYLVCGHLGTAAARFAEAARIQPADNTSKQLADLCRASSKSGDEDATPDDDQTPPPAAPAPTPVPLEKLAGSWTSDKGADGLIVLTLKDDGTFAWVYTPKGGQQSEFAGEYSMNDRGLLVLDTDGSQMVAMVELPQDRELKFVLAGGPPGDQGLNFTKTS